MENNSTGVFALNLTLNYGMFAKGNKKKNI